jgi:hypothetical protein
VAPNFGMAMDAWRTAKRILAEIAIEKSEVQMRIELPGLHGVVLDEAASLNEAVWSEAIRPALADRQGWAIIILKSQGFDAQFVSSGRHDLQRPFAAKKVKGKTVKRQRVTR